jgi:molybdopterin-dependent oxidoreductase alpha subunit
MPAGWKPFGLGEQKPHHYLAIAQAAWENRDNLAYAWRILDHGVCDGCSLGPAGLHDDTLEGVHLCLTRLQMLRLNTMPAMDAGRLEDAAALTGWPERELRGLGRLPYPLLRRRGDRGFRRITWDEAVEMAGARLAAADPHRVAFYTTSRGLTNETYYVAAKVARLLGTNNIDNAARLCHAASTVALKQAIGWGASTCSYSDWIGTEFLAIFGSHLANNQPVSVKYLHYAKKAGTRIVVVNPYREPGLERYWIPSVTESALFGTRLMDDFFQVRVGGDIAFLNGVLRHLIENNWVDRDYVRANTTGFDELQREVLAQRWEDLERLSGLTRAEMHRFAQQYGRARTAVFIWSMGLTQHRFGVDNVKALINVGLARGIVGRDKCGLVPIRGHSGVQGAAECGAVPGDFPGGFPVNGENAARFSELWGAPVPSWKGMSTAQMIEAAAAGALDVFYIIGGNFLDTMPDPERMRVALERVPLRIHQDIVVNNSMLAEPGEAVLLLPGQTRYEQRGGGTLTSTERRIRFSPEIPGPRIGESRAEWEILQAVARRAGASVNFAGAGAIRAEMDRVMPLYAGIKDLRQEGDAIQYGGPHLQPKGKAVFSVVRPPENLPEGQRFYLATRRGNQFNSILYSDPDPLTGAHRDEVFMSADDAARLGLRSGDRIRLRSETGEFTGRCRLEPVAPGTLQAFWPEVNRLITCAVDPMSGEPDYNTWVTVERTE